MNRVFVLSWRIICQTMDTTTATRIGVLICGGEFPLRFGEYCCQLVTIVVHMSHRVDT